MSKNDWPAWATEEIVMVDYNPAWPLIASWLIEELKSLYDFNGIQFEHIGSTAVPNLPAKPVIDFLATVHNFNNIDSIECALKENNWHLVPPDLDKWDYRRTFVKVVDGKRFAHLHLILADTGETARHIAFRDILRQQSGVADDYAQLKKKLADTFKSDREAYTHAKAAFIVAVLDKYLS